MAEAQQEVKFSFPIAKELIRLWKKRIGRLKVSSKSNYFLFFIHFDPFKNSQKLEYHAK